ncbi:MAG TPA: hypothetical protein VFL57_06760 [Bryobacteraceae bacterium]|nr:hypothetical protein [Bryobacteraceae bacterium]
MTLAQTEQTVAGYMILIGQRIAAAQALAIEGRADSVAESVSEIEELVLRAIEQNRDCLGLGMIDRAGIMSLVPPPSAQQPLAASEYLVDMESAVLRYKAHRPGLRSSEAAPRVLSHLLEILSAAAAWTGQHGRDRK